MLITVYGLGTPDRDYEPHLFDLLNHLQNVSGYDWKHEPDSDPIDVGDGLTWPAIVLTAADRGEWWERNMPRRVDADRDRWLRQDGTWWQLSKPGLPLIETDPS